MSKFQSNLSRTYRDQCNEGAIETNGRQRAWALLERYPDVGGEVCPEGCEANYAPKNDANDDLKKETNAASQR